jgi:hypothetical protein
MAVKTATHVRMAGTNGGGPHEHIQGVCTDDGKYHSRREVVESIDAGDHWRTFDGTDHAPIRKIEHCKHPGCPATPYITTHADDTPTDNLDNLPRCHPPN